MAIECGAQFLVSLARRGKMDVEDDGFGACAENFLNDFGINRARPRKFFPHEGERARGGDLVRFELAQVEGGFIEGEEHQILRRGIFQSVADHRVLQGVFGQLQGSKGKHGAEHGKDRGPCRTNEEEPERAAPRLGQGLVPAGGGLSHAVVIFLGALRAPYKKWRGRSPQDPIHPCALAPYRSPSL